MDEIQYLYNASNELQGVLLPASLWQKVESSVLSEIIDTSDTSKAKDIRNHCVQSEPVRDWEQFLQLWDYRYPQENSVVCKNCGASTEDWTADEPRKFILKAANIGGLVAFHCCSCECRVFKRHFKDNVKFEFQHRDKG